MATWKRWVRAMSHDSWLAKPYENQPDAYQCDECLRDEGEEHDPDCPADPCVEGPSMVERLEEDYR